MRFLFIFIFITFASCKSQESAIKIDSSSQKEIPFTIIKSGTNSGYKEMGNIHIYGNLNDLDVAWDTLTMNFMNKEKMPEIDFEINQLYIASMGERNSGGYSIKITSVIETKKNIIITIEESTPGSSCMTTSVMTYPYQIIELKRLPDNKKIIYTRNGKVYECEK